MTFFKTFFVVISASCCFLVSATTLEEDKKLSLNTQNEEQLLEEDLVPLALISSQIQDIQKDEKRILKTLESKNIEIVGSPAERTTFD